MRRTLAGALLLSAAAGATAQAPGGETEPMRVEGSARWGTIQTIKEPHYPPSLRDGKGSVYIDISGRVLWSGELTEIEYTPGSEEAKAMLAPMRVVMDSWRFHPPLDGRCQPSNAPVKTRVGFDFSTDPPTLSTRTPDAVKAYRTVKTVSRVDPSYPLEMRQLGFQSHVHARVTIDPAGAVTDVLAVAYPQRPDADLTPFVNSTTAALRQWKFNAEPDGTGDRRACWHIFYKLVSPERSRARR